MPQIEAKFWLRMFAKLCRNPCVFGPQLCIRFWVHTMISLLKRSLSLSVWRSGWREIWNIFPAICCVCWWPRTRISVLLRICYQPRLCVDYVCDTGYLMNKLIYPRVGLIFLFIFFLFSSGSCTCKRYMNVSSRQRRLLFMIGFLYQEGFLYSSRTRGRAWGTPHF